jgi:hypothetical protein
VVVPVGAEEPALAGLLGQVDEACARSGLRCELLLVGWGRGRSAARAAALLPLPLSRGEARALLLTGVRAGGAAVSAGLRRAGGDVVLLLDPRASLNAEDLERALPCLAGGAELVVAQRPAASRGGLRRRAADLLLGAPANAPGPGGFVLLAGPAAAAMPLYGNLHALLPAVARHWGLIVRRVELPAHSAPAPVAPASGLTDLLAAFFLLRFARLPLRFFGPIGAMLLFAGTAIDALLVYQKLVQGQGLSDRPLLLLGTLLMVLGVQALSLGLVAELIVFIHARKLRDYRIGEEWRGEPEVDATAGLAEGRETAYLRAIED